MQDCSISSALALEILQSWTKSLIFTATDWCRNTVAVESTTWWCHGMKKLSTLLALTRATHRSWCIPHTGPVIHCKSLVLSLLLAWTNYRRNSWVASDLKYHDAHVTSLYWELTNLGTGQWHWWWFITYINYVQCQYQTSVYTRFD